MNVLKRIKYNSPVVLTFVLISFSAYVLNGVTNGLTNQLLFSVYPSSTLSPFFFIRLFGHVFGHANWNHFSGNIIMILLLGPLLEEKYGSWNMGAIIFVTALVTGLVNVLFFSTGLLGASGVVFAFILLSSITSMKDGKIALTFIIIAIVYIGGEITKSLFVNDNISNITHIIGGIIGCAFGTILNRRIESDGRGE